MQQQAEPQAAQAPVETAATAAEEAAEGEEGGAGDGAGGMPDLDLLSAGLPPGWQAMWDDTHAKVYYGNLDTSVSGNPTPSGSLLPFPPACALFAASSHRSATLALGRCPLHAPDGAPHLPASLILLLVHWWQQQQQQVRC